MAKVLRTMVASRLRSRLRVLRPIWCGRQPTIAEGWEEYAQRFEGAERKHLGDEWNRPQCMGLDVPADRVVAYLDDKVFAPFLGECEVVLEIGSGGGRFTEMLLPKCERLIAADTSRTMLRLLRRRFGDDTRLEYLLLDGRGLFAIPDRYVDAAFSYGVFVHLQH